MKIKRILCAALAAALLTAFSGCDSNEKENDRGLNKNSPVTITIWHYYNGVQQTGFDDMVKEFNDTVGMEKGIIVQAFSKNSINELADSIMASLNKEPGADEAPNIFGCYADNAFTVDQMGMLADISQYFTEEELSEYVDGYIQEGRFDGNTLKIFPTAKSTEIMIVNSTDWEKFAGAEGVSYDDLKTWESLVEVSEKYYNYTDALTPDVPNDGKPFFGRDSVENYMLIGAKQLGKPLISEDGETVPSVDKETVKRLWENYYVPFVKGYFAAEGRFRSDDVKIGKVIALVCSTTGAAYYPNEVTLSDDTVYPIENVVLSLPNFENTEAYAVQQGAGMSVIKSDEKT
ncbi:MAG: extracellular solute-binding protein, partial [Oscillospiraceae bacterium]|nr:extracellular solute-binding protein [Oscillospiraceae bacterium]